MKFERIPEEPTTIEAEFFDGTDIDAVYDFLEKNGIQAEVDTVRIPGPGRSISDGMKIQTILDRNNRTLTQTVPCWVAVSSLQWVKMYGPEEFERRFRPCE